MNQSENRSSTNEDAQEESGWTTYLEDFELMNNQRENYRSSCYEDDDNFGTNSLLSDAASNYAPWKNYCNTNYNQLVVNDQCSPKRLNMKKLPRNKKINDHDLEDTASSPVNSPKGNEGCSRQSRQFQETQKVERGNYL
ncbi:hypothetical protein K7X08_022084 [Anisodus acutangulus]|uniref:Uncharacterized protein n=1 Tax=Anisodus acutangulus TaxID=402998 RepID=A0A9Q1QVX7_9SOLA|nr:hypothetical protein K7X08_022084 [Anisodus acutangulus]